MHRGKSGEPYPKTKAQMEAAFEEESLIPEATFAMIYFEDQAKMPEMNGYYAQISDDNTGDGFCTLGFKRQEDLVALLEDMGISIADYA